VITTEGSCSYRARETTLGGMTTLGAAANAEVTAREAEVLGLIARHLTNAQIAEALFISRRTVETHVSALLRKLQLPDRRSLARHAEAVPGLAVALGRQPLPASITSFIGRTAERAALTAALAEHRMVTATGPGGVGKTRLALSIAEEADPGHRDGVWFVDLVHETDPAMVTERVAQAVGMPEQSTGALDLALIVALAERDALLVLDNCEHVLDGVRSCVEPILASCPGIRVLATSRTRLLVPYEWVYAVPGLSPGDAVDLFATRVTAAVAEPALDTARVIALCEALDGMALAIELAAARYPALGLDGLEAGMHERLRLLAGGGRITDRHRSLRDAIAWSYDLLAPDDRCLLRGIAVFASRFDVDAAHAVAGPSQERAAIADGLARLTEQSLLLVERGTPTRYRMLETIRQYGTEQLELCGELDQTRAAHKDWCGDVVAALRRGSAKPDDSWCARFDHVADDMGTALVWLARDDDRQAQAAELAEELAGLLFLRGRPAQAQRRYEQAADLTETWSERVRRLRLAAGAAASRFAGSEALRLLRETADVAVAMSDRGGAARDLATMAMYIRRNPGIMAEPHSPAEAAGLVAEARAVSDGSPVAEAAIAMAAGYNDPDTLAHAQRAVELAEQTDDAIVHSAALDRLVGVYLALHDVAAALRVVRRRIDLLETMPIGTLNGFEFCDGRLMAADTALAAGDLSGATAHAEALARLPFYRDEDHLATCRRLLVDALAGRFDDVVQTGELFRVGWDRAGRPVAPALCRASYAVAMVHGIRGDEERRAAWVRVTIDAGTDPQDLVGWEKCWAATFDALLALHCSDLVEAERRLAADIDDQAVFGDWDNGLWRPWYAALWAEAAVLAGHAEAEERLGRSRHAARDNPIATAIVERAGAIAARDRAMLVSFAGTFAELGCPYQEARTVRLAADLP
jgi:predicted ATPase/DNA-binding CsgD family transcriptional regulator